VIALHFGIDVFAIEVINGKSQVSILQNDYNRMTSQERFIILAGGVAGECCFFKNHDLDGKRDDEIKLEKAGGGSIEDYLSDAMAILSANDGRFNRLNKELVRKWETAKLEAFFDAGPENYVLLSKSEIDLI